LWIFPFFKKLYVKVSQKAEDTTSAFWETSTLWFMGGRFAVNNLD